jgi:hypothetical protein
MPTRPTDLSVKRTPYQMASNDKIAFTFPANEPVTAALGTLVVLPAATSSGGATVTTVALAEGATITVSGLVRGTEYELKITFTRANTTKWSRTLNIDCVA